MATGAGRGALNDAALYSCPEQACDDGNSCTFNDQCAFRVCSGAAVL